MIDNLIPPGASLPGGISPFYGLYSFSAYPDNDCELDLHRYLCYSKDRKNDNGNETGIVENGGNKT